MKQSQILNLRAVDNRTVKVTIGKTQQKRFRLRTHFLLVPLAYMVTRLRVHAFYPQLTSSALFKSKSTRQSASSYHQAIQSEILKPLSGVEQNSQEDEDEDEFDYSCYPPYNPLFDGKNVITQSMPSPSSRFIERIAPTSPNLWEQFSSGFRDKPISRNIGVDVIVEFSDAKDGAAALMEKCLASSKGDAIDIDELNETEEYIRKVLSFFQQHISEDKMFCKARIASSIGSAGQKCPRWHVDHVPLRLVMSLAGPGCVYIPFEKETNHGNNVNRDALNGLDEADNMRANTLILPHGDRDIAVFANEGDVVLLMGRAWEQEKRNICATPHRSPELGEDQLRVLLIVDIVPTTHD